MNAALRVTDSEPSCACPFRELFSTGCGWPVANSTIPVTRVESDTRVSPVQSTDSRAQTVRGLLHKPVDTVPHDHPAADHDMPDVGRGRRVDHRFGGYIERGAGQPDR